MRPASLPRLLLSILKPGIVAGNGATLVAGYLLGARGQPHAGDLAAAWLGTSLLVACGAVGNNWIDRDLDRRMARTRGRATARDLLPAWLVLGLAAALGAAGAAVLAAGAPPAACWCALGGLAVYLGPYSLWLKRRSALFGTPVGSLAGAMPPLVGHCAATGGIDRAGLLLGLMLCLWQLPHFYAVVLARRDDFVAAGLPALPLRVRPATLRAVCAACIALFAAAAVLLVREGCAGPLLGWAAGAGGLAWGALCLSGARWRDQPGWGRAMFRASIAALAVVALALALDAAPGTRP